MLLCGAGEPDEASTMKPTQIAPTVDFERDGVQHGFLRLPHSRDDSAWGAVMIPVCVVKNGEGPTALLTGGNHGDEYEGPVALVKIAAALDARRVQGRVIVVPFMNYPAFRAGRRTSPIDQGNMNRVFPGRPDGSVTEKIADYFQRYLLPLADVVLDIHSGGKTLDFLPFAACHELPDKAQEQRCRDAMAAFGAPYSMIMKELDGAGMYDTAAEESGAVFVTTELGGGGSVTARSVEITETGVRNLLAHAGILEADVDARLSTLLDMADPASNLLCEHDGLLEPCVDLGAEVAAGQLIGRVHPVTRTGSVPVDYCAMVGGILAGRHFPGLVQSGDTLAVVARIVGA
jgi:N-alpha-acetyl-L-2,4-diaminobutyrate deacetylase